MAEHNVSWLHSTGTEVDAGGETRSHAAATVRFQCTCGFTDSVQADRGVDCSAAGAVCVDNCRASFQNTVTDQFHYLGQSLASQLDHFAGDVVFIQLLNFGAVLEQDTVLLQSHGHVLERNRVAVRCNTFSQDEVRSGDLWCALIACRTFNGGTNSRCAERQRTTEDQSVGRVHRHLALGTEVAQNGDGLRMLKHALCRTDKVTRGNCAVILNGHCYFLYMIKLKPALRFCLFALCGFVVPKLFRRHVVHCFGRRCLAGSSCRSSRESLAALLPDVRR